MATRMLPNRIKHQVLLAGLSLALALPVSACAQTAPTQAETAGVQEKANQSEPAEQIIAGVYNVEIVNAYPHDPEAFTQGLLWHDGALYESTGIIGKSSVRRVDLKSGKVEKKVAIPADQFGEGLAVYNNDLLSLTWQNGVVHRWNSKSLENIASTPGYRGEGWGLTTYKNELYASDGSDALKIIDPQTYQVKRTIPVRMNGEPISMINELEAIDGYIFANLWTTRYIVGIDPANGNAEVIIDLASLPGPQNASRDAVLNGIAWDPEKRRIFVTGKNWDKLYEIRLVPKPANEN